MHWTQSMLALLAGISLLGCYARTVPLDPAAGPSPPQVSGNDRIPWVAGVRLASPESRTANVPAVAPVEVALLFARRLDESGLFDRVVFPFSDLADEPADLVFTLDVRSAYDRKPIENLVKDLAVGASLLLLQPLLPTRYDLSIEIRAPATHANGNAAGFYRQRTVTRFASNRLRSDAEAVQRWHAEAAQRTVDAILADLQAAHAELAAGADMR